MRKLILYIAVVGLGLLVLDPIEPRLPASITLAINK